MNFTLTPGKITLTDLHHINNNDVTLSLAQEALTAIQQSQITIEKILQENRTVYGINTGFGILANTKINNTDLETLQKSLLLSHATGVGELLDDATVKLILLLKINSLARGYSGVRLTTIEALIKLFNAKVYPCIPAKGSVGASGDLAPLAHLACVLIGVGSVRYAGKIMSAEEALNKAGLKPLTLAPKEGLALINGTQVSTALALKNLLATENIFFNAVVTGAMSVDAAQASAKPFDERIQLVRGHATQIAVAEIYRDLLAGSEIIASHAHCEKIQDPYSLRCQPQVMGACLAYIQFVTNVLLTEANAVSDNPLVFSEDDEILSGGNFHAQPVAMAADTLALSISEIGSMSERRIAMLMDSRFSGLPAFLVNDAGLNSGFMIAQVTAAALVSENKSLAYPSSVDTIPTSANQEDHVSMATYAAHRLTQMTDNTLGIVAIELLAACQGLDFRSPLKTSPKLQAVHKIVRQHIPFYAKDRFFAPDINQAKQLLMTHQFS